MSVWFSRGYLVVLALLLALSVLLSFRGGGGVPLVVLPLMIAAYIWWPALRGRVSFLRSDWSVGVQMIAPYAVISVAAIVGSVFLALNVVKMV